MRTRCLWWLASWVGLLQTYCLTVTLILISHYGCWIFYTFPDNNHTDNPVSFFFLFCFNFETTYCPSCKYITIWKQLFSCTQQVIIFYNFTYSINPPSSILSQRCFFTAIKPYWKPTEHDKEQLKTLYIQWVPFANLKNCSLCSYALIDTWY